MIPILAIALLSLFAIALKIETERQLVGRAITMTREIKESTKGIIPKIKQRRLRVIT